MKIPTPNNSHILFVLTHLQKGASLFSLATFYHLYMSNDQLKWKTSDPWERREEIPNFDDRQKWEAELLEDLTEERTKRRFTRRSSIPEDVDELREKFRKIEAENKSLRIQAEILETLGFVSTHIYEILLSRMGLSDKDRKNPYAYQNLRDLRGYKGRFK